MAKKQYGLGHTRLTVPGRPDLTNKTAVIMVGDKTLEEALEEGGGGGGGGTDDRLPNPTKADKGKFLGVDVATEQQEITIVPTQDVTIQSLGGEIILEDITNPYDFVPGVNYIATIKDNTYTGVVEDDGNGAALIKIRDDNDDIIESFYVSKGSLRYYSEEYTGTYPISLKVVKEVDKVADTHNIIPLQAFPANDETPFTGFDPTYFVKGNTVVASWVAEGEAFEETTEVLESDPGEYYAYFPFGKIIIDENELYYDGMPFGDGDQIKIDCIEYAYEYKPMVVLPDKEKYINGNLPNEIWVDVVYDLGEISSSSLTIPPFSGNLADGKDHTWTIMFDAKTDISNLSFASDRGFFIWQNDDIPSPENGHHYEISIRPCGQYYYATYMDFYHLQS